MRQALSLSKLMIAENKCAARTPVCIEIHIITSCDTFTLCWGSLQGGQGLIWSGETWSLIYWPIILWVFSGRMENQELQISSYLQENDISEARGQTWRTLARKSDLRRRMRRMWSSGGRCVCVCVCQVSAHSCWRLPQMGSWLLKTHDTTSFIWSASQSVFQLLLNDSIIKNLIKVWTKQMKQDLYIF